MKHVCVALIALFAGCGESSPMIDTSKPAQRVQLSGNVELVIDHAAGRFFAKNNNTHSVGVVVEDRQNQHVRIFSKANIEGGKREEGGTDLSPRGAFATVYVYKDSAYGVWLDSLAALHIDFTKHLDADKLDSVEGTPFIIE